MNNEIILKHIWDGTILIDDSHLKDLRVPFLKNLEISEKENSIEKYIKQCTSELGRIQIIKRYFEWKPVPNYYFERFKKSAEISILLREKANKSYKEGKFVQALRGYNLAIVFARTGDEELGLAYGNRSALFVQIKEPCLALVDINLALRNKYPSNLKDKMIERQNKCNSLVEKERKSDTINEEQTNIQKYCDNNLFILKTCNPSITNAEEFVKIDFTQDRGRRLVVNKNIPVGTVLVVEEPFVSLLENILLWDMEHCHFCSKQIRGGIPCEHCTFALYCSEGCRNRASDSHGTHKFEHNFLSYLHCHSTCHSEILAVRMVSKIGPTELFRMFTEDSILHPSSTIIQGFNENGLYDSSSYLPSYHLISHPYKCELSETVSRGFKALIFTHLLKDTSQFFYQLKDEFTAVHSQDKFETFVASLILRHLENIPYNAISLSELKCEETNSVFSPKTKKIKNMKSVPYATVVYSLISLANHSCDPNTVHVKKPDCQKAALVTLRRLNVGDEVFITYKPQFTLQDTPERQKFLFDKYNFICKCVPCLQGWSVQSQNFNMPTFQCKNCSEKGKTLVQCEKCEQSVLKIASEAEKFEKKLYSADDLIQQGEYIEAVNSLNSCLDFFSLLSPTFALLQVAQDLYKRALICLVYSYK